MSVILVVGLSLAASCAFLVLLTLPRWFARSLGQDRIWRLRDRLVEDALVSQILPKDHCAVRQLVWKMDWALRDGKHYTLLHVYLTERSLRQLDQTKLNILRKKASAWSLEGLDPQQCEVLSKYRETFEMLFAGSLLLGSWFGLLQVAIVFPRALKQMKAANIRLRATPDAHLNLSRRIEQQVRGSAQQAADQAAAETPFGIRVREWIRDVMGASFLPTRDPDLELALSHAHAA